MATEAFTDFVVGHGELWSALLFAATVKSLGYNCAFMDTRDVLVVTPTSDGNSVDIQYDVSNARLDAWVQKNGAPEVIVATGFIAKNPLGQVQCSVMFVPDISCAARAKTSRYVKSASHVTPRVVCAENSSKVSCCIMHASQDSTQAKPALSVVVV